MSEKYNPLLKSQMNSFKYASKETGRPFEDFYNAKTGNILKPWKDFVKENPDKCKPIVQSVVKACEPLYDRLIAGEIKSEEFAEKCLLKKGNVRERGICYTARKGMPQPKGLKEYREKQEKIKAEMRKTGIINSK